jgi:hypothetical protein
MTKTRKEVEFLKENWRKDPCYDLEDVEGFEEYKAELHLFSVEQELKWEKQRYKLLAEVIRNYRRAHSELMELFNG